MACFSTLGEACCDGMIPARISIQFAMSELVVIVTVFATGLRKMAPYIHQSHFVITANEEGCFSSKWSPMKPP